MLNGFERVHLNNIQRLKISGNVYVKTKLNGHKIKPVCFTQRVAKTGKEAKVYISASIIACFSVAVVIAVAGFFLSSSATNNY